MDIVYATANAVVGLPGGGQARVRAGSHWPASDPVVLAQPSLFSTDARYGLNFSTPPAEPAVRQEMPVEQATAAPGERRNRRG
jgi:hypothetical protein